MVATVVNIAAWIAAGALAFYLLRDFIKVEKSIREEEAERRARENE